MVRWIKLVGKQWFGFWWLGLVLFGIQEIPYMVMPFMQLEANPIMEMQNKSVFLNGCEKVLGSLCIALMCFVIHENAKFFSLESMKEKLFFGAAVAVILANFVGWGLYFNGYQSIGNIIGFLVVLPPLYYVLIGLWRNNSVLVTVGGMFAVTHMTNVWNNLR